MALMYEVNTLNAAMVKAAEACRQDMPEGDKVNAVLACFAGMKPVEAEPVVHARWVQEDEDVWYCTNCGVRWLFMYDARLAEDIAKRCPECGAHMDAKEDATCG